MTVGRTVRELMGGSSWIRRMFEEGVRLKRELGPDQVADLALGNPILEPPPELAQRLREIAADPTEGQHRYMPNAGYPSTRAAVARHLASKTGLPYTGDHVVMSVGAGGGINVVLKALLDPGDEVILLAPYFVEYRFYVSNHGGREVILQTDEAFRPRPDALAAAITPRTRAVLVNSPNNPTGVVYSRRDLDAMAEVLRDASARHGRPIYLLSDEPYRAIAYDGVDVPWPALHYPDTILVTSFSKDLGIPGERIGYVAVNPATEGAAEIVGAATFTTRILGFVNAPAIQQRLIEGMLDARVDVSVYARKRERLLEGLRAAGYDVVPPQGAFYMFPRVPEGERVSDTGVSSDIAFVRACVEERLLVVPGSGFGRPGHFRLSYAVSDRDIELACGALDRVRARV